MDIKKIKHSEYFPVGVNKINDGGLYIDMDKIKTFMPDSRKIRIEYHDGSELYWFPVFID